MCSVVCKFFLRERTRHDYEEHKGEHFDDFRDTINICELDHSILATALYWNDSYICSRYPGREIRNNSWLQFNRLFNNRGTPSPTRPQSVGGNYFSASALKPRIEHTS